jgi:hypothetical protein
MCESKSTDISRVNLSQNAGSSRIYIDASSVCRQIVSFGSSTEKTKKEESFSNPSIGYGSMSRRYANGALREFYQVGVSANTSGISVYIIGLNNMRYLSDTYGQKLGKAKITGYCIKFKSTRDIAIDTLEEIIANSIDGRPSGG